MKQRFIGVALAAVLLLSGCHKPTDIDTDTTSTTTTTPTVITTTTQPPAPYIENATPQSVFGYYEGSDGKYYCFIDKFDGLFEIKNRDTGVIEAYAFITEKSCTTAISGIITVTLTVRHSPDDREETLIITVEPDGTIRCQEVHLSPITESVYNTLVSSYPAALFGEEEEQGSWYETAFDVEQVKENLQAINNLFAVGRFDEAEAGIQEKIYDTLDAKVNAFLLARQYWHAENYVAMYARYLDVNAGLYGVHYPYVENYFNERYQSYGVYHISSGIYAITQPYFDKILTAAANETDVLSRQESLYLLNEYLIGINMEPATALDQWSESVGYFYGIYDYNAQGDDLFHIVCPYSKEVYPYLPRDLFFVDNGVILG